MTWTELRAAEREVGPVDRRRARAGEGGREGQGGEELAMLRGVFRRPVSDEELEACFQEAGL